jgi:replicative DNA helicase
LTLEENHRGDGDRSAPERSTRGSGADGFRRSARADLVAPFRAIPADHEAERAVLGAILLDHESLYKVIDKITATSFDLPRHRILFEACMALADRQQAITLITLRNYLQEREQLEKIGGIPFLAEIADSIATAAHVEAHADVLREKSLARSLIRTCESLASRGYDGHESPHELIEAAEREVLQIAMGHADSAFSDMPSELPATMKYIHRVQAGEITGTPTGFTDLDEMTGGLSGGDLVILAARPSMGKTAFALSIARNHAVETGGCVAVFSLEMTTRQLVLRLLMAEAQRDLSRFRRGVFTDRDMEQLSHASTRLEQAKIFIDDTGTVTVSDLAAKSRRLDREQRLSLIIVDYIQLIQGRGGTGARREQEVAEISRSLKLLAKDLDVPIIALSQLNRSPELRPNKRPMLADLRESGAIEQDADIVLMIYRDEVYDEDSPDRGIAEIIVTKQRNGPTGTVKLQFEGRFARFGNLSARQPDPPETGFGADTEPPF